jgi:hypothetical protein
MVDLNSYRFWHKSSAGWGALGGLLVALSMDHWGPSYEPAWLYETLALGQLFDTMPVVIYAGFVLFGTLLGYVEGRFEERFIYDE